MALTMLRFSVSNICRKFKMGCDNRLLASSFILSKRLQHAVKNLDRMPVIQFKKLLQDEIVVDRYRERMEQIIKDIEIKPDNLVEVDSLTNIILEAAIDVCGTSQKFLFKCSNCKDVFSNKGNFTLHKRACSGFINDDSDKRKCDKCLKYLGKLYFYRHYKNCQGIKVDQMVMEKEQADCPDCGKKMNKSSIIKHQQNHCKNMAWSKKSFVKCSKCGTLIVNNHVLNRHMEACTGLIADDPNKRKCDKCLKEVMKTSFSVHYKNCKGSIETKSAKVNCPDCGKEMAISSLERHKKKFCRGKPVLKSKIFKESDQLSDIIMKVVEDVFRFKDTLRLDMTEEKIQWLRSKVTRVIKVTMSLPDTNRHMAVCPDCGLELSKDNLKRHQRLSCPERQREN